ncbi:aldo/keto reductase [Companilactobacillus alimentarius]|uniref:Aldo/keto reductase n=1 Tax=Companilactobacillus alimentarius DSM 20249 TaxID=1423720 RepID=A0A2K9HP23_9LACO|nr:aldo/keto reductase [Companilactobacillus alimentarius]AUI72093.1 aldo/keto reductase [Companilactobacillus alimentarius DSM 20249]KRK78050.1 oxidoreductase [Companilactobacillus alimentarius DSM 20249]MDT6952630.1 aldo/keto reductase [Companilactobacillus alimentarius]GEO44868.1 aldo/keto reductase [Companilactobacillus alimentarius]
MKQRYIGETNWQASAIALGIMRMNSLSPKQAAEAIDTAYDNGINFIDSADIYGDGDSEKIFGQALKQSGVQRDNLYIQSKGGIVSGKRYDFSKQHLIDAVDGSLERMGVDYLDSFLVHRPDPLMEPEEVAQAFDELQTAGKVRHFGVSNFNPQQYLLLQEAVNQRLIINQLQFSIMHSGMIDFGLHTNMTDARSINHDGGLLEFSRRMGVTVQAWSPFQYGNFAGTFINSDKFPDLNKKLQELADKYGASKNAIAAAWILRHPADIQVIIGTMNPEHIADSAKGGDINLTKQEWYDIYFAAGNDLP